MEMDAILELAGQAIAAGKAGTWAVAIGAGLTLLIKLADKLRMLRWVPRGGKKWVAMALAAAGAAGSALLLPDPQWFGVVGAALSAGLSSIGANELMKSLPKKAK